MLVEQDPRVERKIRRPVGHQVRPEFLQGNALEERTGSLVEHPEIADRQGDEVKGPRRPHRVGGDHVPAVRRVHQTLEGAREYGSQGCDGHGDLPGRQRRRRKGCRRWRNGRALPRTPGNPMGMDGAPFPGLRRSGGVESSYFDDRAPDKRHFPRDLRPSRAIPGNRTGISDNAPRHEREAQEQQRRAKSADKVAVVVHKLFPGDSINTLSWPNSGGKANYCASMERIEAGQLTPPPGSGAEFRENLGRRRRLGLTARGAEYNP